ncbi:MAG: hypothetical protein Q8919_07125, partial [Bacteroidota bacterium]|nr:hypothetical protein [Bacteroidota bacterium]
LTDLLGEPDIIEFGRLDDKKRVSYLIERTYDVIDPDYTKHLVLILNKDSVVEHFTIEEWRK